MNKFQSIVYSLLFWTTSCYLSSRLLIPLKKNLASLALDKFFTNVFSWSTCYSEHFAEKEKREVHLMQSLWNMVDKVKQASLNFSSPISIFMWNGSFFCLKTIVPRDMRSFTFFSLKEWGTQTPILLIFPIFFSSYGRLWIEIS